MKFAQMALMDRAGGLTFVMGGAHETSHHYSCTVFSAMMELRNEIQLGRLVMYILGSLPVERKNVIVRGYLHSLGAGSKNFAQGQDPHEAFGRGPMAPTVVAVGLRFRSWHVVNGQFPHMHCLLSTAYALASCWKISR